MAKDIVSAKKLMGLVMDFTRPIRTFEHVVGDDWTDFNGHMNEARYLDCFSNGSDAIMQLVGCDEAYITAGKSYFTVETHIRHLDEVHVDQPIYVTTQVLQAKGKKMHLFHLLFHEDDDEGRLLASGEQMLLHVDLQSRKTCEPEGLIVAQLDQIHQAHSKLEVPVSVGRGIAQMH